MLLFAGIAGLINPKWFTNKKTGEIPKRSEIFGGTVIGALIFAGVAKWLEPTIPVAKEAQENSTAATEAGAHRTADPIQPWIKPDSFVKFPKGQIACLDRNDLQAVMTLGMAGRGTKMKAYFDPNSDGGLRCLMLDSNVKYKVIDAEANDSEFPDALIVEVVGASVEAADHGAYALVVDRTMAKIIK